MATDDERQTEVDAACEAITARGERPTVDRVRELLGGGSPNKLTPLVRGWKERQRNVAARSPSLDVAQQADDTPVAARPLMAALTNTIGALQTALDGLPQMFVEAAASAVETERRRSNLEIQSIQAGAEAQVRDAVNETAEERALVELLRQEVDSKDSEISGLAERLSVASTEAQDLRTRLDTEISQAAALQSSFAQATVRIAELEAQLQAAKAEAATASGTAEVLRSELKDGVQKMEGLQLQLTRRAEDVAELQTKVALAEQARASANAAAAAAEAGRDTAIQQSRADAERAGAAEARATALEQALARSQTTSAAAIPDASQTAAKSAPVRPNTRRRASVHGSV